MKEANESKYLFAKKITEAEQIASEKDRKLFAENTVWLLRQTALGVTDGYLDNEDRFHVRFGKHSSERLIDVSGCSYGEMAVKVLSSIIDF